MIIDNKNLIDLMQDIHLNALTKGFWDSKDREINIKEKFQLIVCELCEAVEADRAGKRVNLTEYHRAEKESGFQEAFMTHVKGTVEEEIADAIIRALDLCGWLKVDLMRLRSYELNPLYEQEKNFAAEMYYLTGVLAFLNSGIKEEIVLTRFIYFAIYGCRNKWKIDIFKIIWIKHRYNKERPYKHGKKY